MITTTTTQSVMFNIVAKDAVTTMVGAPRPMGHRTELPAIITIMNKLV